MNVRVAYLASIAIAALVTVAASSARAEGPRDAGESPKYMRLKHRASAPKHSDIDGKVSLHELLARQGADAFSSARAATITGYVVQAEREEDGDVHLVLAESPHETTTTKWVIVEVTPDWQKRNASLSTRRLHGLVGHEVRATGWLFYEPDTDSEDPRGTRWELHPVTSITRLDQGGRTRH